MSRTIDVNEEIIDNDATQISNAVSCFMMDALSPTDTATTLTANAAGQQAYADSQQIIEVLGENLEREVNNIRSIGAIFAQYDAMLANLLHRKVIDSVIISEE